MSPSLAPAIPGGLWVGAPAGLCSMSLSHHPDLRSMDLSS